MPDAAKLRALPTGEPTKVDGQWYYRTSFGPRSEIFVLRLDLNTESPVWVNYSSLPRDER